MPSFKKKDSKIPRTCTNCFRSNHITFNFAYVCYDDDFGSDDKIAFIDRLREISSVNYLEMRRWDKYKGFEEKRIEIKKQIPIKFTQEIEIFDGKYSIMRLYKGNCPTPGRIIGKIINKVFYIFFLDVKGKLYEH